MKSFQTIRVSKLWWQCWRWLFSNGARHPVRCDVRCVPVFLLRPPWLLMMVGKFNQSSINLHNTNDDTVRQEPASLTCQTNSGTQYTQHSTPPRKLQLGQQHTNKKPQIIPTFKTLKPLKREIPRRKAGYLNSFDECLLHKVIYAMSNNIEKKT